MFDQRGKQVEHSLYEAQDTALDRPRAGCQSTVEPNDRSVDPQTSHVALLVALRARRQRD
jgi:hypothetical protein